MNIITFYNDKINKEFPILQKKVFQKYKQNIKQFLIKDWVINKCGLFDENFYPAYCEDVDYILKLRKANILSKFVESSFYHGDTQDYEASGSQTSVVGGRDLKQKIDKAHKINRKHMCSIWGDNYEDQFYYESELTSPKIMFYDLNFNRKKYLGF